MPPKQPDLNEIVAQFTNAIEAIRDSQNHLHTRIEVLQSQNSTFRAQTDELFGISRASSTAFAETIRDVQHLTESIKLLDHVVASGDLSLKDRVILMENKINNLQNDLSQLENDSKQNLRDDKSLHHETTLYKSQNTITMLVGLGGWAVAIVQMAIEVFFKSK